MVDTLFNPVGQLHWEKVKNAGSTEIPAHGLMRVTGEDEASGALTVDQPNADHQADVLVNGPLAIPVGGFGIGTMGSPVLLAYEMANGSPAIGGSVGVAGGSWKAKKHYIGFKALTSGEDGIVFVARDTSGDSTDAALWSGGLVSDGSRDLRGDPAGTGVSFQAMGAGVKLFDGVGIIDYWPVPGTLDGTQPRIVDDADSEFSTTGALSTTTYTGNASAYKGTYKQIELDTDPETSYAEWSFTLPLAPTGYDYVVAMSWPSGIFPSPDDTFLARVLTDDGTELARATFDQNQLPSGYLFPSPKTEAPARATPFQRLLRFTAPLTSSAEIVIRVSADEDDDIHRDLYADAVVVLDERSYLPLSGVSIQRVDHFLQPGDVSTRYRADSHAEILCNGITPVMGGFTFYHQNNTGLTGEGNMRNPSRIWSAGKFGQSVTVGANAAGDFIISCIATTPSVPRGLLVGGSISTTVGYYVGTTVGASGTIGGITFLGGICTGGTFSGVTTVTGGAGITVSGTPPTVTVSIDDGDITTGMIADDAVTADKIADGAAFKDGDTFQLKKYPR